MPTNPMTADQADELMTVLRQLTDELKKLRGR